LARWLTVLALSLTLMISLTTTVSCSSDQLHSDDDATRANDVTAEELYAAYSDDAEAADERYKGELLNVNGVITYVGTDLVLEAPQVILSGGGREEGRGVDCVFDTRYETQVEKLEEGETVSVLGVCDGSYKINVLLVECQLVRK